MAMNGETQWTAAPSRRQTRRRRIQHVGAKLAVTGALLLLPTAASQSVTGAPAANPSSAGSTLSPTLPPSYVGMGIEPIHLFDYLGRETGNELTYNLLNTLGTYTGTPPHLRIGGNSGDSFLYSSDPAYSQYDVYPNPNSRGQGTNMQTDQYFIGPAYFQAMNMLPKGTPITYGVNLAYNGPDYIAQIVNQAAAPLQIFKNVTLVGLEIGNEPDLYVQNGFRPNGWSVNNFGDEWAERVKAIYQNVLQPRNMPSNFFEPATTATTASRSGREYRISNLINTGVAVDNGIYVSGWNQHDYYYYVDVSTYTLTLSLLLDMSTLQYQLTEWQGQAQQAKVTGKNYYLREFGSVGPTGLQGITDVFANTLWTLNAFLYTATIGISSVQIHMTSNSYASPWQPIPLNADGPHVRTTYYAFAAMAQIIGRGCTTQVSQVSLSSAPSGYNNLVAMYAVYQFDTLRSLVLINTKARYTGQQGGSMDFVAQLPSSLAGQTLYLATLDAAGIDAQYNTTWNGISYEQSGDGRATLVNQTVITTTIGADGTVTIPVRDSQAVVASLNSLVGREQNVDVSACSRNASSPTTASGAAASTLGPSPPAPTFKATDGFTSSAAHAPRVTAALAAVALTSVLLVTLTSL